MVSTAAQLDISLPGLRGCPWCGGLAAGCARCGLQHLANAAGGRAAPARLRVGLVEPGCERATDGLYLARALYGGELSGLALEDAERTCDEAYLLSGRHGLLPLGTYVEAGDHAPPGGRGEFAEWARRVVASLRQRHDSVPLHVVLYAGRRCRGLVEAAPADWVVETPFRGRRTSERVRWLKVRRTAAGRGMGMGTERGSSAAHFTVLRAAQLRVGDEIDRPLRGHGGSSVAQVTMAAVEGPDVVVGVLVDGFKKQMRFAADEPVVVMGRHSPQRERPAAELRPRTGGEVREPGPEVAGAVAAWAAERAPTMSPGHREGLARALAHAPGRAPGSPSAEDVGAALLASAGDPGAAGERLAGRGVLDLTRRAFDGFWQAQADQELAGDVGPRPPLWTLPLPASPRVIVVCERAADAMAYHQAEGVEGAVYVAVGGALEAERAGAVQGLLETVQRMDAGKGLKPLLVAAFGATREGTLEAKALRTLRPPGMAFDRHSPPRGQWGDRFASRAVSLPQPKMGRGR